MEFVSLVQDLQEIKRQVRTSINLNMRDRRLTAVEVDYTDQLRTEAGCWKNGPVRRKVVLATQGKVDRWASRNRFYIMCLSQSVLNCATKSRYSD